MSQMSIDITVNRSGAITRLEELIIEVVHLLFVF
jgi:hypothetical protein